MKYIRNRRLFNEDGSAVPGNVYDWFKILATEEAVNYDKDPSGKTIEPVRKRNLDDCSGMYDPYIFGYKQPIKLVDISEYRLSETLDPLPHNITPEVPAGSINKWNKVELLAMDFDGVIGKKSKWWGPDGIVMKECDGRDGFGIGRLMREILKIPVVVISNEDSPITRKYCEDHDVEYLYCNGDVGKDVMLCQYCTINSIDLNNVCFIGDDITDMCAMNIVGMPVAVRDCHPSLFLPGIYRTYNPGGGGAVREIIDLIYISSSEDCPLDIRDHVEDSCIGCTGYILDIIDKEIE